MEHQDSIAPTARVLTRILRSPAVKWIGGGLVSLSTVAFTAGIWPFFKGWVVTRASDDEVAALNQRVKAIEEDHKVDWERMQSAGSDYLKLTHGEKVYWSLQTGQRNKEKLVEAYRQIAMLEAEVRTMERGGRNGASHEARVAARRGASTAYLGFIKDGILPDAAVDKALESLGLAL